MRFLVRGVRHRGDEGQDAVDRLGPGDRLDVAPDPDNPADPLALLAQPHTGIPVGWIPAYLCPVLRRSSQETGDFSEIVVTVPHVGDRHGPSHFRLLCDLHFPWPFDGQPFDTATFACPDRAGT